MTRALVRHLCSTAAPAVLFNGAVEQSIANHAGRRSALCSDCGFTARPLPVSESQLNMMPRAATRRARLRPAGAAGTSDVRQDQAGGPRRPSSPSNLQMGLATPVETDPAASAHLPKPARSAQLHHHQAALLPAASRCSRVRRHQLALCAPPWRRAPSLRKRARGPHTAFPAAYVRAECEKMLCTPYPASAATRTSCVGS